MNFCGFWEKLKNLIMWVDPIRTVYFLTLSFILTVILWKIPLRYIMLISSMNKSYYIIKKRTFLIY